MTMHGFYIFIITIFITTNLSADLYIEPDINEGTMATPTCETYVEWTGKNVDEINLSILKDRRYRIIKPDSMVTMDYIPDRLNIETTQDGIILTQNCG